jgi:hypothetical protein
VSSTPRRMLPCPVTSVTTILTQASVSLSGLIRNRQASLIAERVAIGPPGQCRTGRQP